MKSIATIVKVAIVSVCFITSLSGLLDIYEKNADSIELWLYKFAAE